MSSLSREIGNVRDNEHCRISTAMLEALTNKIIKVFTIDRLELKLLNHKYLDVTA